MRYFTKQLFVVWGLTLLTAGSLQATTYYIDYAGGNDANSGSSKAAPWRRHPWMNGFSGSYLHSAGDRFIFKGGVTWPNQCFQMHIAVGGSSDSNRDYYGTDQSWFTGGAWARPLFDFQHVMINGGAYNPGAAIFIESASYITVDGLELANLRSHSGPSGWGPLSLLMGGTSDYITITNSVVRDWDFDTIGPGLDNEGAGGMGFLNGAGGNNVRVTHCLLHQAGVSMKCGAALRGIAYTEWTEIHHATQGVLGGAGVVHDCHIHDMVASSDPNAHCNAIETFSPATIYNCLIHDLAGVVSPIALVPDWGNPGLVSSNYVYNCVLYNCGGQTPIGLDTGGDPSNSKFYIWNNTVIDSGWCVRTAPRGGPAYGYVELRNNQFITPQSPGWVFTSLPNAGPVTVLVTDHNLLQTPTAALSAGYVIANLFQPTTSTSATLDRGVPIPNFAFDRLGQVRPQGAGWDIGAYEFNAGIVASPRDTGSTGVLAPAPPTNLRVLRTP